MFKLIIAGGRDFSDYELLKKEVDLFLEPYKENQISVISGKANGADSLGERYANENGYNIIDKPAEWKKYGIAYAGTKRNEDMARIADGCICFWDGLSKGTQDMIRLSNRYGLISKVVYYIKRKDKND